MDNRFNFGKRPSTMSPSLGIGIGDTEESECIGSTYFLTPIEEKIPCFVQKTGHKMEQQQLGHDLGIRSHDNHNRINSDNNSTIKNIAHHGKPGF